MQTGFCRMKDSLGEPEPCPGDRCAFWEGGSCAFQSLDLRGRPQLAGLLLELRGELESVKEADDARAARRRFFRRLNAGSSD